MARHRLTDDQWVLIADIFPPPAHTGRPRVDRRMVVDGILWIMRTGAPWRDLPDEFGKWGTVYDLFTTWNSDGTLDEILDRLQAGFVDAEAIDEQLWCVDGTNIRAARCAAGAKKGAVGRS
ncbi:IS5 family transposase [Bremerella cremea]|uniref:IS5 family transposase n=1 Tax=Bremerella cremea TaxID=1031537 RepID=A0A368KV33_9BACT|nr:IS5 family transposase [Bremerella cremea]RCS49477.1 IS5 family transposase [Bremerella cremea]